MEQASFLLTPMFDPLYRPLLRQTFKLVLRHKNLWFLGLVVTLFGAGGQYELLFNQYSNFSEGDWSALADWWQVLPAGLGNFFSFLADLLQAAPGSVYLALAAFLAIIFILVLIVVSSQGALILGVAVAAQNQPARLSSLLWSGYKSFWSLLALALATRLLALFILAVVGLPILAMLVGIDSRLVLFALALLFFVLAIPVFVVFSIVAKFAFAYHLLEKENWRGALNRALSLFAGHWLVAVEIALALFIINIAAAGLFVLAAGFLSLPFILLGLVLGDLMSGAILGVTITLGLMLFLFLVLLLGSALSTFQNAAWTLLFLKIKDQRQLPKLARLWAAWRGSRTFPVHKH